LSKLIVGFFLDFILTCSPKEKVLEKLKYSQKVRQVFSIKIVQAAERACCL